MGSVGLKVLANMRWKIVTWLACTATSWPELLRVAITCMSDTDVRCFNREPDSGTGDSAMCVIRLAVRSPHKSEFVCPTQSKSSDDSTKLAT